MQVRKAVEADLDGLARMRVLLWPTGSGEEHRKEALSIIRGEHASTLPLELFVAEHDGKLVGFVEVGLRSHADGCNPERPTGYVEGWYVDPELRRHGVGRLLIERAEAWAAELDCTEVASDTWITHEESQAAHAALGFEVVDRCVHYRKRLTRASGKPNASGGLFYGAELARIHHDHFGMIARGASQELAAKLETAGFAAGTVVDLAAGTGILSRALSDAGFDVTGVDISPDMIAIAREHAPTATFVHGSFWEFDLPRCVAVAAIGEAFSYAADPTASLAALERRLGEIHDALAPGGVLVFDVVGPGRSGPDGVRRAFFTKDRVHVGLEEREDRAASELCREITLFVRHGSTSFYRRSVEKHTLRVYAPADVERSLTRAGFVWERLTRYGDFEFPAGYFGYAATRGFA